jgi:clan AA aspartic protease
MRKLKRGVKVVCLHPEHIVGHVNIQLTISNPSDPSLASTVEALVDTGATVTVVPRSLADQLKLNVTGQKTVRTANGIIVVDRSSAILQIDGKSEINPIVISDTLDRTLVGVVTLETLELAVDPTTGRLTEGETLLLTFLLGRPDHDE